MTAPDRPPPFASWKDPGIKIASVKVLRFTIVTTRQLLDGLQSQTWKSMAIVEESRFKSTNIVTKAYNSGMAALIIVGWRTLHQRWIPKCAEHCGQSSRKMSLQSFEVWMQWLDYQLYIWTSSIILWDVGSILRHFTPGISAAWVIIAVSGGDEDILKPGLWIWVQLLARGPLTATTLEVHWLHPSWHHIEPFWEDSP